MFDRHFGVWPEGLPHRIEMPERNVCENLQVTADRVPDKAAIIYHGRTLSFAELASEVDAMAGWLQQAGVAKGDRVLLYMQNSPQFVIGYYAILRANAVVVPVNPMNRAKEVAHLVRDTGASVAIVAQELLDHIAPCLGDEGLSGIVAAACADYVDPECDIPLPDGIDTPAPDDYGIANVVRWRDAIAEGHVPGPVTAGADDLAVIPYTSGTTGQQKGCMHTHRTVMVTLVGGIEWNPVAADGACLSVLPLFHVTGMQSGMNGPIFAGGTIVLMSRWDRRAAGKLIERHRIARWRSISTMAIDMLNDPDIDDFDLTSLKMIGGGGAAMPEAAARRFRDLTGLEYIEGYGMSETMAATHINPVHRPMRQCLGIPVFGVDARIIDPDTRVELGPDEVGEIILDAPQAMQGYWNNPEATAEAFIEHDGKRFLRTGDIARYDRDGYFFLVDRSKRMINASGFKVWPSEVESLMHDHPAIAEVCIVGYPDPRRGESVMACAVRRTALTEDELIAWCRENMAAYKVPRRVRFFDALPRSSSGKVEWMKLQKSIAEELSAQG